MGTSSAFGGQGGGTPLVPSWLGSEGAPPASHPVPMPPQVPSNAAPAPLPIPPLPPLANSNRFSSPRANFTRFVNSGGTDKRSMGRAVSGYVRSTTGGPGSAASRMGSARGASNRLLSLLSDVVTHGPSVVLQRLNLGALAGRPIEEIFIGLADHVCPNGGSIDEGIAREAFIETITDLAGAGITDLDRLTEDQMYTVLELYATNAIEARLCNDIGTNIVALPSDAREAARLEAQLNDFIRRGVADALTPIRNSSAELTSDAVHGFVDQLYTQAFDILQIMGDAEAGAI